MDNTYKTLDKPLKYVAKRLGKCERYTLHHIWRPIHISG